MEAPYETALKASAQHFAPFRGGADPDLRDVPAVAPELKNIPPGPEWVRVALERLFVDPIPAQMEGLEQVLRDFAAELIIGDDMFGSVNRALSFGIPIVGAGLTEDKADVNARIAWSGVGVNLGTNEPTSQALREAVRTVLDDPGYRSRASAMAKELGGIDTRSEILRILTAAAQRSMAYGSHQGIW